MSAILKTLQEDCAARLAAQAYFTPDPADDATPPIPVLIERMRDIESQIELAVGQAGLCVLLVTPFAGKVLDEVFPPYFEQITVVARVFENVPINTSLPRAADVAEAVAWYLHHFRPTGSASVLGLESITLTDGGDSGLLTYDITFKTRDGSITEPSRT